MSKKWFSKKEKLSSLLQMQWVADLLLQAEEKIFFTLFALTIGFLFFRLEANIAKIIAVWTFVSVIFLPA